jgi:biotin carboxyl carrier protein
MTMMIRCGPYHVVPLTLTMMMMMMMMMHQHSNCYPNYIGGVQGFSIQGTTNFIPLSSSLSHAMPSSQTRTSSDSIRKNMDRLYMSSTIMAEVGTVISMPALSSTMKEGRVVSWLKSEGDTISAGEAIMVVESDKADMDVEAFEDGVLAKILVDEGNVAAVGAAVAIIAPTMEDVPYAIASLSGGSGGSTSSSTSGSSSSSSSAASSTSSATAACMCVLQQYT